MGAMSKNPAKAQDGAILKLSVMRIEQWDIVPWVDGFVLELLELLLAGLL